MSKKIKATEKVDRAKKIVLRALHPLKYNQNRAEVLGIVTGILCDVYALLETDNDDELARYHLSMALQEDITGVKNVQVILPVELKQQEAINEKRTSAKSSYAQKEIR